jgi:2,3-bisphosphoglycerate-dependent phosphoglycerate mutase
VDYPDSARLTDKGQAEAAAAGLEIAARTKHNNADSRALRIITSDLARAQETANAIAKATGLPITTDPRLRERTVGIFDGMTFAQAKAEHPVSYAALIAKDVSAYPAGAETDAQCYLRVSDAISDFTTQYPLETTIVVSHGIAIYHMLSFISGIGAPTKHTKFFTLVDNASLSIVQRFDHDEFGTSWRLCHWNQTDHLKSISRQNSVEH